ncbi:ribonuclease H-like domain-containing protein, partial [Tanacetum coccineum]
LAEQKSREEDKARENVEKFKKHLIAEEIKKLVEGSENVEENVKDNSSPLRNDDNHTDPSTRLEPRSDKESLEVEGKHVEEIRNTPSPTTIRSPRFHSNLISSDTEKPQELTENDPTPSSSTPSSSSPKFKLSATNRLLSLFKAKPGRFKHDRIKVLLKKQVPFYVAKGLILEREKSQADVAKMIVEAIQQERENLRLDISAQVNVAIANHIHSQFKFENFNISSIPCRPFVIHPRDQDDPHDDAHPERDNNDDVIPNEKVSQELVDEISQTIDEAKLRKVVDEMLRQQCHEHKFITKVVARRANGSIVSITESDYKNLNKNDIKDMYFLIINHKVDDHAETGLLWSLSVFIRSISLRGLKSYNNDVKHGYVTPSLSHEDVEYLQLFKEEIEERLKHHDQMRRECDSVQVEQEEQVKEILVYIRAKMTRAMDMIEDVQRARFRSGLGMFCYSLFTGYDNWEKMKGAQEYEPTTTEEKQDRRNEMKARATLLMALPNTDQLKFHSYQDAKLLMEAIKKRYGGNKESKKVQRTLLKQQYENFVALSSETMDQTFDRLQKLISQLEIQGEVINQEDMNLKLLGSLPSEWKTHALIWRNKVEIETINFDDLHNNLKIYKSELTGSASTSQNPSPISGDNLSDALIYAFLASQPNSSQMSREDLEQINPDDLEEMDLQWEMAMLTIRAIRFIKRTGRQLDVNGKRVGFDRTKVECYNCHKYGHFTRECRFPRNQENKDRENNTRTIIVETPTQNAWIAQDGIGGYDWSYQAEEEKPTNYALIAFTSLGSSSSSDSEVDSCSKTCLESVEARLAHYKKNEVVFEESINVLKLEVRLRDNALDECKMKLDKEEKERDQLGYNAATTTSPAVESFVKLSDKSGSYKGYHSIPLPLTGNFIPRKPDLTFIDEIVESENMDVTTVVTPSNDKTAENKGVSNTDESNAVRINNSSAPIIEDWNSDDESEIDYTVRPSTEKINRLRLLRKQMYLNKTNTILEGTKETGTILCPKG